MEQHVAVASTIGVLVIDLEGTYSRMIWPSIAETIQSRGHDCLIIPANNPRYPYDFLYQHNHLFNFIRPDVIDVLILVPNTFMNFIEKSDAADMISRIRRNVPVVSMNHLLHGSPSLLIDAAQGIREGVQHLVRHHGYRKIGFVQGPADNPENIERRTAFLTAMDEEGIRVEDDWIFTGDFTRTKAAQMADSLGEKWVGEFDALFTANDYTAVGIISSLQKQGYVIPRDLAIVGFDNIDEAPYFNPPLSSVRQPFSSITEAAANTAAHLCEGREVSMIETFGTSFVRRASCGCEHFMNTDLQAYWQPGYINSGGETDLNGILNDILKSDIRKRIIPTLSQISDIIVSENADEAHIETVMHMCDTLMDTEMFGKDVFTDWCLVFIHFILYLRYHFSDRFNLWESKQLVERIFILASRKREVWTGYISQRWEEDIYKQLQSLQQNMAMVRDLSEMADMVTYLVRELGMENCCISLIGSGHKKRGLYSTLPAKSHAIFAVKDGERQHQFSVDEPEEFTTMEMWPASVKPVPCGKVWTVTPLFSMDELYGFMVNEIKNLTGVFTIALSRQVSTIVQRSRIDSERRKAEEKLQILLKELEKRNRKLKKDSLLDELTGLFNRRGFMLEAQSLLDGHRDEHTGFCLYFADMDGLKFINDNYGHPEGDRAIQDMAEILKAVFREEDIIARLGGDEFTILAFDVREGFESLIEERLNVEIARYQEQVSRVYRLSLSIGSYFGYSDQKKLRLEEVMKDADDRLYSMRRERRYGGTSI